MTCLARTVSSLEDFKMICGSIQLEFAANFGDTSIPGIYEFATDDTSLLEKLHWLAVESNRLDDETAIWELYWCLGCAESRTAFPLHVRPTG
jgi:hypothetical protein